MKLNILLVGEESAGIQALKTITEGGHRLVAVMAKRPGNASRGASMWDAARRLGHPTWPAELVKNPSFAGIVCAEAVDLILNVHSLYIMAPEVMEAPRLGSFNLHPGPLPRYAGLNAPSWALYRGETMYGVTLHKMVSRIDAGPIAYQASFPIEPEDSALSVYLKCVKAGLPLIVKLLETAVLDPSGIPMLPQDLSQREYLNGGVPQGGCLVWSRPARDVVNLVRACDYHPFPSPWGHPKTWMGDREFGVVKAGLTGAPSDVKPGTVGRIEEGHAFVACADEWILVKKVQVNGQVVDAARALKPGDSLRDSFGAE